MYNVDMLEGLTKLWLGYSSFWPDNCSTDKGMLETNCGICDHLSSMVGSPFSSWWPFYKPQSSMSAAAATKPFDITHSAQVMQAVCPSSMIRNPLHCDDESRISLWPSNASFFLHSDLLLSQYLCKTGSIMFHVRRRPADYHLRKRKKKPQHKWNQQQTVSNELLEYRYDDGLDSLPLLLELNSDGSEISGGVAERHRLHPNLTEVGCERNSLPSQSQYLQLFGSNILPRHCVISNSDGIVTVTPCSRDSETYVNGQLIYETTILRNGAIVKFGRIHCFRFLDPFSEDQVRQRRESLRNIQEYVYDRIPSATVSYQQRQGVDVTLPAILEIRDDAEAAFLNKIIASLDPDVPTFKLAPTYCLYMMTRYRASTHYRPELTPFQRAHRLTLMLARVANMIQKVIQERYCDITSLALWLANSSELLFFLQFDQHLIPYSKDARRMLAESVQLSFRRFIVCIKSDLSAAMPHFFAYNDDTSGDNEESATEVLFVLASAMSLLRKYRVNVALTVQIFSHLFHFIDEWAINRLVAPNTNYCSRAWGCRLKSKLAQIEMWVERQGLEISTDMLLARIVQAAYLLQAPKYNVEDLASLSSSCFLLNSLQLRTLLMKYQIAPDEPLPPKDLIENVVKITEKVDKFAKLNGLEVKLDEDPEDALEFVLPMDSYSCEVIRGIPPGLVEFVIPLQNMGLCRLSVQLSLSGLWTVYMKLPNAKYSMMRNSSRAVSNRSVECLQGPQEPEIHLIKLHKSNNGIGLSIVAAKGVGHDRLGIYIKSVVKGGVADADGRLQAGDQLLKVGDQCLVGVTQEKAAEYLVRTGPIVTLQVAKQGAIYHGLTKLLSEASSPIRECRTRPHSKMFLEPFRDVLPTSFSMINLNHTTYMDHRDVHWLSNHKTNVTPIDVSDVASHKISGGSSSSGACFRTPTRNKSFQSRYGNFLHPDYALLYPNNFYHDDEDNDSRIAPKKNVKPTGRNLLTADWINSVNATLPMPPHQPITSETKMCFCKNVLQKSQEEEQLHSKAEAKANIMKKLVSDVTLRCSGVIPESDGSVRKEQQPMRRIETEKKSVMTNENMFQKLPRLCTLTFRNSCPLTPPRNDLCDCEKPIFRNQLQTGKIVYQNGIVSSSQPRNNLSAFDDSQQGRRIFDNGGATNKSLQDLKSNTEEITKRSNGDACLYRKDSMVAECTRCGNRFNVCGTYFNGSIYEKITSISSSSTEDTMNRGKDEGEEDSDRKLTIEEREYLLNELEEIMSGEFFTKPVPLSHTNTFNSSMLHLDLKELHSSRSSSPGSPQRCFELGSVAELTKHFSMLTQGKIILPTKKTKSMPDVRETVELFHRPVNFEVLSQPVMALQTTEQCVPLSECTRLRQSYAHHNTVFCHVKSVDDLDFKQRLKTKLYKHASLADFRATGMDCDLTEITKKYVSADDLTTEVQQNEMNYVTTLETEKPQLHDEIMEMSYHKMTTAIRDFLANKKILLKRIKSNSTDNVGVKNHLYFKFNACSNLTSVLEAKECLERQDIKQKSNLSLDMFYFQNNEVLDYFSHKENIRRVFKSLLCKRRRVHNFRKVNSYKKVLIFPAELLDWSRLQGELKMAPLLLSVKSRCQSLGTAVKAGNKGLGRKLCTKNERLESSIDDDEQTTERNHSGSNRRPDNS